MSINEILLRLHQILILDYYQLFSFPRKVFFNFQTDVLLFDEKSKLFFNYKKIDFPSHVPQI